MMRHGIGWLSYCGRSKWGWGVGLEIVCLCVRAVVYFLAHCAPLNGSGVPIETINIPDEDRRACPALALSPH